MHWLVLEASAIGDRCGVLRIRSDPRGDVRHLSAQPGPSRLANETDTSLTLVLHGLTAGGAPPWPLRAPASGRPLRGCVWSAWQQMQAQAGAPEPDGQEHPQLADCSLRTAVGYRPQPEIRPPGLAAKKQSWLAQSQCRHRRGPRDLTWPPWSPKWRRRRYRSSSTLASVERRFDDILTPAPRGNGATSEMGGKAAYAGIDAAGTRRAPSFGARDHFEVAGRHGSARGLQPWLLGIWA